MTDPLDETVSPINGTAVMTPTPFQAAIDRINKAVLFSRMPPGTTQFSFDFVGMTQDLWRLAQTVDLMAQTLLPKAGLTQAAWIEMLAARFNETAEGLEKQRSAIAVARPVPAPSSGRKR